MPKPELLPLEGALDHLLSEARPVSGMETVALAELTGQNARQELLRFGGRSTCG